MIRYAYKKHLICYLEASSWKLLKKMGITAVPKIVSAGLHQGPQGYKRKPMRVNHWSVLPGHRTSDSFRAGLEHELTIAAARVW